MAWVGIAVLVVAGAITLVLAARADRRASAPRDADTAAPAGEEAVEPSAGEPEPGTPAAGSAAAEPAAAAQPAAAEPAAASEPVADVEPGPTSVGDEAVRARIATLAAELRPESEPAPALEAEVAPARSTTAQEAERVFASVAAVGRPAPEPEAAIEPETHVEPASAAASSVGHEHERPVANHSDLLAHVRAEHDGIPTAGSTIEMRILHEQAHAGQPAGA